MKLDLTELFTAIPNPAGNHEYVHPRPVYQVDRGSVVCLSRVPRLRLTRLSDVPWPLVIMGHGTFHVATAAESGQHRWFFEDQAEAIDAFKAAAGWASTA